MIAFTVVWFIVVIPPSDRGLWTENHFVLSSFQLSLSATMLKSYSVNPLCTMNTTIFQEASILYHNLEPIIERLFQKIILVRSLRSSFIKIQIH